MIPGHASSLFVAKRPEVACASHVSQAARQNSPRSMYPRPARMNFVKMHIQAFKWIEPTASGRLRAISDNWSNMASGNQSLGRYTASTVSVIKTH